MIIGNFVVKVGRGVVCRCCFCCIIWSFFSNFWGEIILELLGWLLGTGSVCVGSVDRFFLWVWCFSVWGGRELLKYISCVWVSFCGGVVGVVVVIVLLEFGVVELVGVGVLVLYLFIVFGVFWSFFNRFWVLEVFCIEWEVLMLWGDFGWIDLVKIFLIEEVLLFLWGRFLGSFDNGWRSIFLIMSFWMVG